MVLSMAFIIAFIAAAVGLLIGILIFSEISDSITCPTLFILPIAWAQAYSDFLNLIGLEDSTYDSDDISGSSYLGQQVALTGQTITSVNFQGIDFSSVPGASAGTTPSIAFMTTYAGGDEVPLNELTDESGNVGLDNWLVGNTGGGTYDALNVTSITVWVGPGNGLSSGSVEGLILSGVGDGVDHADVVIEGVSSNSYNIPSITSEGKITFVFDPPVSVVESLGDVWFGMNVTGDGSVSWEVGETSELSFDVGCLSATVGGGNLFGFCDGSLLTMDVMVEVDTPVPAYTLSGGISPSNLVSYYDFEEFFWYGDVVTQYFPNKGSFGHNASITSTEIGTGLTDHVSLGSTNPISGSYGFNDYSSVVEPLTSFTNLYAYDFMFDETTQSWGMSFWIWSDTFSLVTAPAGGFDGDHIPIFNSLGSLEEQGIRIMVGGNQEIAVDLASGGTLEMVDLNSTGVLTDNNWQFVGLTIDKSTIGSSNATLYLNGTKVNSQIIDLSPGVDPIIREGIFSIGETDSSVNWATRTSNVVDRLQYDEICIWHNYLPTPSDMVTLYNSGSSSSCTTPTQVPFTGGGPLPNAGTVRAVIFSGDPDILGDNSFTVEATSSNVGVSTYGGQSDIDLNFTITTPVAITNDEVFIGVHLDEVLDPILWPVVSTDVGDGFCVEGNTDAIGISVADFELCGDINATPGTPADLALQIQQMGSGVGGVGGVGFEQCENAKDIAWTVIGILPVALFFGVFAIFSAFGGRQ